MISSAATETNPSLGARQNLDRALDLAESLIEQVPAARGSSPVRAIGACTFGVPTDDGVELSPAIPGWNELPLRRLLQEEFRLPTVLLTDVKAAAAAEARHGALAGADPAIYVNLGTGLAVALVHDGKVVTGAHGASGEIGYNLRAPSDLTKVRGHRPIVEDIVSGMGLASSVARLDGRPARLDGRFDRPLDRPLDDRGWSDNGSADHAQGNGAPSAVDVFELAKADTAYEAVLEEFLRELCYHVVNLTIAVDPERIAVGGGMVRSWEVIEPPMRAALESHVPYPPELVIGAFPFDAALRGALGAGLELARSAEVTGQPRTRQSKGHVKARR